MTLNVLNGVVIINLLCISLHPPRVSLSKCVVESIVSCPQIISQSDLL